MNQLLKLLKTPARMAGGLFVSAIFVTAQGAVGRPGTINYAEGQVTLDGAHIGANALGKTEVAPGRVLETDNGKAEMLLVPGAYLRLGQNSAVKMVSPSITDTRVELLKGQAMVEVDQIQKENHLGVLDHGAEVRMVKKGIYSFNADQPMVAVYDGKAEVRQDDRTMDVGKGKELSLQPGARLKPQKFDRNQGGDLYAWSNLRSSYLAQANMSSAQTVVMGNYPGWWYGTGWYWNPWFSTWAFLPGDGFFYSPFGYGFYSPAFWYYNAPAFYTPGRVWVRRPVGTGLRGVGTAAVPARPAVRAPAAGAVARPSMPAVHAMGGSGARFGGRR